MSEQVQDLTPNMQELIAQMARMQAELNDLKQRANKMTLTEPEQPVKPVVSVTRRKALRRLAGGLLAGLAVGTVGAVLPGQADAKFVAAGGAGAVVIPPGGTVSGTLPANTIYGLIGTPDSSLNLGNLPAGYKAGVLGIKVGGGANTFGVFGNGGDAGVYGSSTNLHGVEGRGPRGVYGQTTSVSGIGVYGPEAALDLLV